MKNEKIIIYFITFLRFLAKNQHHQYISNHTGLYTGFTSADSDGF